jgi:hypothetical protein
VVSSSASGREEGGERATVGVYVAMGRQGSAGADEVEGKETKCI